MYPELLNALSFMILEQELGHQCNFEINIKTWNFGDFSFFMIGIVDVIICTQQAHKVLKNQKMFLTSPSGLQD